MTTKQSWNPKPYVKCTRCEVMRPPADCRLDTDSELEPKPIICSDRATCECLKAMRAAAMAADLEPAVKP